MANKILWACIICGTEADNVPPRHCPTCGTPAARWRMVVDRKPEVLPPPDPEAPQESAGGTA